MQRNKLGILERLNPKKVWSKEEEFTDWLYNNIEEFNKQTGFELVTEEKEAQVGPFSIDILATYANRPVVIENQLEETDHSHLGQLITYLYLKFEETQRNQKAQEIIGIWIAPKIRKEHIKLINFLNKIPDFFKIFLVKLEVVQIKTESCEQKAPSFTIIEGPTEEISKMKSEAKKYREEYFKFFTGLINKCNTKTNLFKKVSPKAYQSWIEAGAGKSGLSWLLVILRDYARVELSFYHSDKELNKNRFKFFMEKREKIEKEFGESLIWDFDENRKHQHIRVKINEGGLDDEEKWDKIQEQMVEKLVKLEQIFTPLIEKLPF